MSKSGWSLRTIDGVPRRWTELLHEAHSCTIHAPSYEKREKCLREFRALKRLWERHQAVFHPSQLEPVIRSDWRMDPNQLQLTEPPFRVSYAIDYDTRTIWTTLITHQQETHRFQQMLEAVYRTLLCPKKAELTDGTKNCRLDAIAEARHIPHWSNDNGVPSSGSGAEAAEDQDDEGRA